MQIYYCYSCSEYFKVSSNKVKDSNDILCPYCDSFDTEHSPEEEESENITDNIDDNDIYDENSEKDNDF
jgi:hypothetical protein